MNPTIKARWIADLRSGKYRQCKRAYHDFNDGYCCLGVLAYGTLANEPYKGDTAHQILDAGVSAKQGKELVKMNDSGKTFDEIADWIEVNL